MLIVGSDRPAATGPGGEPAGTRHAVDLDGSVLCRTGRARFTWPGLRWDEPRGDDSTCRLCGQVRSAQEVATWQPSAGLFEPLDR